MHRITTITVRSIASELQMLLRNILAWYGTLVPVEDPENFGGGDDKNFKHKTSKIRMCCNQAHSQKFAIERLI